MSAFFLEWHEQSNLDIKQAMNKDLNTPVWQLTAGELIDFIACHFKQEQPKEQEQTTHGWKIEDCVYGVAGVSKLLGCSRTMVYEYRKQGWLEPAIRQFSNGRKIVCNAPLALELFGKQQNK